MPTIVAFSIMEEMSFAKRHFIGRDGKEELKEALSKADDPFSLIESLQNFDHFDFSEYQPMYQLADFSNVDIDGILASYIEYQKNMLVKKIETMMPEDVKGLLRDLKDYADLPCFEDVIRLAMSKVRDIPTWFEVPENLRVEMTPADHLHIYTTKPEEFKNFLDNLFDQQMCDFEDTDNFSYLKLFNELAPYCYSDYSLYKMATEYCEENFMKTYHSAYCVTRIRLSLGDSPFARVDSVRPLSILVTRAVAGEADFALINKATVACPEQAEIILSLPQFSLKYHLKSYLFSLGLKKELQKMWMTHLNNGDSAAIDYMKKTPLFARVIALCLVQKAKVSSSFMKTLENMPPQCDVAYILCRNFDPMYDRLLKNWALKNGSVFIDYLTMCKARGYGIPSMTPPELTYNQRIIYESIIC